MGSPESTAPPSRPFMDVYFDGTNALLDGLGGELEHIGELTARAASVIRHGGSVFGSMNFGHLPSHETASARRGNPGLMREHGGFATTDFSVVGPGDMVFTNDCARKVQAARDRGAYIVAVTTSYINNEFRPVGLTCPNEDDLLLRDVATDILHSHVPPEQGLCRAPQVPGVTLCPSAGTGMGTLFWMLTAGLAQNLASEPAGAADKSAEYLRVLRDRIDRVRGYRDRIQEIAQLMAHRVLDGGTWHVRSPEYPGLASELHWVECGPMIVNNMPWDPGRPNVLLINAISPDHPDELALAAEKRREGALVISIGPAYPDGAAHAGRLLEESDVAFDNLSPEPQGVIAIDGRKEPLCPTDSIIGNLIQQMICAQWAEEMIRCGAPPYFFRGINQVGGRDFNAARLPLFQERGY
jgi:hypothetical protein